MVQYADTKRRVKERGTKLVCMPYKGGRKQQMKKTYIMITFADLALEMTVRALMASANEGKPFDEIEGKVIAIDTEKQEFTVQDGLLDKSGTILEVSDLVTLERVDEMPDEVAVVAEATPTPVPVVMPVVPPPVVIRKFEDLTQEQRETLLAKLKVSETEAEDYLLALIPNGDSTDIGPARYRSRIMVRAKDVLQAGSTPVVEAEPETVSVVAGEPVVVHPLDEPAPVVVPVPAPTPVPAPVLTPPLPPVDEEEAMTGVPTHKPTPRWLKIGAGIVLAALVILILWAVWPSGSNQTSDTTAKEPVSTVIAPTNHVHVVDLGKAAKECLRASDGRLTLAECEALVRE